MSAYIDVDTPARTSWIARGGDAIAGGPFAMGESFHEAHKAFAGVVATAISSGSIDTEGVNFDVMRVMSITRKTFAKSRDGGDS